MEEIYVNRRYLVRKLFIGLGAVFILVTAVGAFATYSGDSRPRTAGGNIDTMTFPDGTIVSSAFLDNVSAADNIIVQIKQPDGKTCYGLSTQNTSGGTSISCVP